MIHLGRVVADTRRFRYRALSYINVGVSKSTNREALTEYMIRLTVAEAVRMDSTTSKRKETNINSGVV